MWPYVFLQQLQRIIMLFHVFANALLKLVQTQLDRVIIFECVIYYPLLVRCSMIFKMVYRNSLNSNILVHGHSIIFL